LRLYFLNYGAIIFCDFVTFKKTYTILVAIIVASIALCYNIKKLIVGDEKVSLKYKG